MQLQQQEIWNDVKKTQEIMQQLKSLKNKINKFEMLKQAYDDLLVLIEMGIEEGDSSIFDESNKELSLFIKQYEQIRLETLFTGEYDKNNALLTLHSGQGGTEACDWVNMLYRMYCRFCEKMGFKTEVLDYLEGEETGIKSVTIQVTGDNAFGFLKSEKGVHRLIRLSPFDSSGKRHTSFASCDVMPEIEDDVSIEINDDDLKIDTFRASGAGGQHVNKTDSAIRITHKPTNIVVQCQNERSQHKNRDSAIKMLKAKLFELKSRENLEKLQNIRGEVKDIGFGSQIRTYTFHPYSLVKDHRTNFDTGNVYAVMDGDIINFINAYLIWLIS